MSKSNQFMPKDREFKDLAISIKNQIQLNEGLIGDQRAQVELVLSLERKFQHQILKSSKSTEVYKKFINYILYENGNILNARPFFREKGTLFSKKISKDIKLNYHENLKRYNINYQFIQFIVKNWSGQLPERAKKYHEEFLEARRILIENNLPLAINRAKIFYRKTPKSHLGLLDLIDICTTGLISGVDKFTGTYTEVWRSVCIGRMVGNMIEEYSKTSLRLYPSDRKILYRANSLKYRLQIEDIADLTRAVNESFERDKLEGKGIPKLPIQDDHIRTLLNSVHFESADSKISVSNDGSDGVDVYDAAISGDKNIEETMIEKDMLDKISNSMRKLKILERKIIKLKGVTL